MSAAELGHVVCTGQLARMDKSAEKYTAESWRCASRDEHARIDLYTDDRQQQTAMQVVIDFYRSSGDQRTLDQFPVICGTRWAVSVDFNATRDRLIDALTAAGFDAHLCTG